MNWDIQTSFNKNEEVNIHSYFEKLPKDPQEWKNAWPNVLVFDRTLLKNKMVLRESYRKIRPFNDFIWTFSCAHQALHWLGEVIIHTNAKLDKESASASPMEKTSITEIHCGCTRARVTPIVLDVHLKALHQKQLKTSTILYWTIKDWKCTKLLKPLI